MSDPFVPRMKMYRRKRKIDPDAFPDVQQGKINELEAAKRAGQVHCRTCKRYQPWAKLNAKLERLKKGLFQMVWYCKDCGNAVLVNDYDVRKRTKK